MSSRTVKQVEQCLARLLTGNVSATSCALPRLKLMRLLVPGASAKFVQRW